ncbi:hypothetical protein ACPC5Q_03580 [Acinetobacter junii]|uniref:hypothetical protein n=1 Tax=Acinetobacter junii TaxID=40215 RepID=UPI003C28AEC8
MTVIEFIKEHGVENAREVVEGAPENSICYDLEQEKHVAYEDTSIAMSFLKNRFIDLSELKRLLEDIDLLVEHSLSGCWGIDDIYGIEGTGMYLDGYAFYSNAEEKAELDRLQLALDRTVKAFGGEHV